MTSKDRQTPYNLRILKHEEQKPVTKMPETLRLSLMYI